MANNIATDNHGVIPSIFKYDGISWSRFDPKQIIFDKIGRNANVLDVGCGSGLWLEELQKKKSCKTYGFDISEQAIDIAKKRLGQNGNLLVMDMYDPLALKNRLEKWLIDKQFDYITAIDSLEHTPDPWQIVDLLSNFLSSEGKLIISVPLIVNWKTRIAIFLGRFRYKDYGIMDRTHLRFFDKETAISLIRNCKNLETENFFFVKGSWFEKIASVFFPGQLFATQIVMVAKRKE